MTLLEIILAACLMIVITTDTASYFMFKKRLEALESKYSTLSAIVLSLSDRIQTVEKKETV